MSVERVPPRIDRVDPRADIVDVLDRVLDKGIVIDVWLGISVLGLPVVNVDARAVVASIFTYAEKGAAVRGVSFGSRAQPDRGGAPATRGARRRLAASRTGRRHALPARCQNGCSFVRRQAPAPPVTRIVIPCPYRPRVVCVLSPV